MNMTSRTRAVGVVVPVHNEEELLGSALTAIDLAFADVLHEPIACRTAIVLDNCRDGSATIARDWIRALARRGGPHRAVVVRCRSAGVGSARRLGASTLLRTWRAFSPGNIWLATTDADSRVPRGWISAQLAAHEVGADIWAGRVMVEDWSPYGERMARLWNQTYDRERLPVHGASLGFNAQMYLDVGGFSALRSGEDRALHQAIVEAGGRAATGREARVITSARRQGRAPLGFAHALASFDADAPTSELIA
jgi:hypothetical protein